MSLMRVGLVDFTRGIDPDLMQSVADALNIQVTRDLPQFWPVQATVQYLPNAEKIPSGVWPVKLVESLPPNEGGFHLDRHNQPYAEIVATTDASWSIDASHETIEMLIDPNGNRMQSSVAIDIVGDGLQDGSGQFNYLVEACDPCEANNYGYDIQGVLVSDFITPHFYDPVETSGTRYSFTGALTKPREVLPGGYISFVNEQTDEWQQILYLSSPPKLKTLGPTKDSEKSMRRWIDNEMQTHHRDEVRASIRSMSPARAEDLRDRRMRLDEIAMVRAKGT